MFCDLVIFLLFVNSVAFMLSEIRFYNARENVLKSSGIYKRMAVAQKILLLINTIKTTRSYIYLFLFFFLKLFCLYLRKFETTALTRYRNYCLNAIYVLINNTHLM